MGLFWARLYCFLLGSKLKILVILRRHAFGRRRIWARRAINFAFFAKLLNRAFGALPHHR